MGYIKGAYEWQTKELHLHHVVLRNAETHEETVVTSGDIWYGCNSESLHSYDEIIDARFYFESITEDMKLCFWDLATLQIQNVTNKKIEWTPEGKKTVTDGIGSAVAYASICGGPASIYNAGNKSTAITAGSNIYYLAIDEAVNTGYAVFTTTARPYFDSETGITTEYQITVPNIEDLVLTIRYCKIPTVLETLYPYDIYAKNTKPITFEWVNSVPEPYYAGQRRDKTELYNASSVLRIWDSDGNTKEYTLPGSATSYELSTSVLSTFAIGQINYSLKSIANNGVELELTEQFTLVGQTDAPDIISVSQDNYPVISWSCASQISWQMIIKQGDVLVYDSGMKAGSEQTYRVPVFIENGAYSVEMRALNAYGIYTGWNSMSFVINPDKPNAPTGVITSPNSHFGISVSCIPPVDAGTLYVVRRDDSNSKSVVIGEYYEGFVDYNVALNKSYEYTVRNYTGGSADGPFVDGTVRANGAVIRDPEDKLNYINVWKSENEFDVIPEEEKSDALVQVIGRKYPVAELGEWITSVRRFYGHVSAEDYKKLVAIKLNRKNVILQTDNEVFPCYMEFRDNGKYVDGGRNLQFSFTRIDGE